MISDYNALETDYFNLQSLDIWKTVQQEAISIRKLCLQLVIAPNLKVGIGIRTIPPAASGSNLDPPNF